MSFDPISYALGKAAGGGGGGGGIFAEEWDFTSATPLVGKKHGTTISSVRVTFSSEGAAFDQTSSYINFGVIGYADLFHPYAYKSVTIEAKIASMSLSSEANRRFVMGKADSGIVYRNTGEWGFYSSAWEMLNETDGDLFDNSIVKVVVDSSYKWHVYKDNVLLFEPTKELEITSGYIGSNSNAINNAVIEWLKITAVVA